MIAVSGAKRTPQLPGVPTIAESGLPGFEAYGWYGLFTTAGTPREVLQKLNAEIVRAVSSPDLNERIHRMNLVPAQCDTIDMAGIGEKPAHRSGP